MLRGLYSSAAGMAVQQQGHDVTANNLANANTAGYKQDVAVFGAFPNMLLSRLHDYTWDATNFPGMQMFVGMMGTGAGVAEIGTDWTQGAIRDTGRELDFAINGEGFFVVDAPQGIRYTRNGSFSVSPEGLLVTQQGFPVLGVDGAPLPADAEDLAEQLQVVAFPPGTVLVKEGDSLIAADAPGVPVAAPPVEQGVLEQSNVNVVEGMVRMISSMRAYEANQRAVHAQDETLERLVNEVGRV